MKKVLLATTALVAATVVAGQAYAQQVQTRAPFNVRVTGFVSSYFGAVGAENGVRTAANGLGNQRSYDLVTDSRIIFDASSTADNGLTYGVFLRLDTTPTQSGTSSTVNNGVTADRINLYFNGKWGRLEFGDQKSANHKLFWNAFLGMDAHQPAGTGTGINNGSNGNLGFQFIGENSVRVAAASLSSLGAMDSDSNNATKITYMTPTIAGFSGGISLAPDGRNRGGRAVDVSNLSAAPTTAAVIIPGNSTTAGMTNYQNWISAGLKYTAKYDLGFGEVGFQTGAGYSYAEAKSFSPIVQGQRLTDLTSLYAGGRLDYAGFTLGLGTTFNGKSGQLLGGTTNRFNSDASGWAVGLQYKIGPWTASSYWQQAYSEGSTAIVGGNKLENQELAVTYRLAPGVQLISSAFHYNIVDDGGNGFNGPAGVTTSRGERNGWTFITGPAINF